MKDNLESTSGYANVNGLSMYYEMYGDGEPLVLIHGGGSTIQTSFGNLILHLSKRYKLIAMELQAHGRTSDRTTPASFGQDADDVVTLLQNLSISKAHILGFSNGGHTAIEIALRYPGVVNKLIIASAFYQKSAAPDAFWEGFNKVQFSDMPPSLKKGFLQVNNDEDAFQKMFNSDVQKMKNFKDWSDEQMRSIKAPTLIMNSSEDVGSPEHAVQMYRVIPNAELVILPGKHGEYLGAVDFGKDGGWKKSYVADIIENFLEEK